MNESSEHLSGSSPLVSVVMPAYNAEQFLREAVESILAQTYKDFELLIINDGSADKTAAIIEGFSDSRIRRITHETNLGLTRTLNDGVQAARGQFIARMDADDESLPTRFATQVSFLNNHPDFACIGTAAVAVFDDGRPPKRLWRPAHPLTTKFLALFETPILHPTAMCRTEVMRRYPYDNTLPRSEDYDLWSRMLFDGDLKLTNISSPQLRYRIHHMSFTKKAGGTGLETLSRITLRNMGRYRRLSNAERITVTKYRSGRPLTIRELGTFSFLTLRLLNSFCRKERGAFGHIPGLLRIVSSVIYRVTRRTTRNV